jgi:hypothetical protein
MLMLKKRKSSNSFEMVYLRPLFALSSTVSPKHYEGDYKPELSAISIMSQAAEDRSPGLADLHLNIFDRVLALMCIG